MSLLGLHLPHDRSIRAAKLELMAEDSGEDVYQRFSVRLEALPEQHLRADSNRISKTGAQFQLSSATPRSNIYPCASGVRCADGACIVLLARGFLKCRNVVPALSGALTLLTDLG